MTTETPSAGRPPLLPGAEGIWAFVGADSVVFAVLFVSFMQDRQRNPALFEIGRQNLNLNLGGIDTLILLTSSWCVARAIQELKGTCASNGPRYLHAGVATGALFMVSKSVEYFEKLSHGITPATNSFFMWYFVLTGIHLAHVVLGTALLASVWARARIGWYAGSNYVVPESVATFWHLIDLLWIVLFPLLYLMKAR